MALYYYRICEQGHFIYGIERQVTGEFCQTCGARFYVRCASCNEQLPETFQSPHYMGSGAPVHPPARLGACVKCGNPFPWTLAERRGRATGSPADTAAALVVVRRLCLRFHPFIHQLRERREDRPTLEIMDEYDVQDALHALLALHFDDIRPEEWTPSYAGGASRCDFLLKGYNIVVEAKKTRQGLGDRKLGDELLQDHARYGAMQDCKHLICFVYDPEERIRNVAGLRKDLEGCASPPKLELIVAPLAAN